jgi:hypothetical protein
MEYEHEAQVQEYSIELHEQCDNCVAKIFVGIHWNAKYENDLKSAKG